MEPTVQKKQHDEWIQYPVPSEEIIPLFDERHARRARERERERGREGEWALSPHAHGQKVMV